jgi:hypothetical protein
MSAEGKKKRGEAGQANARNIPFRYGGAKCDLSTRIGSTTHPRLGGSRMLVAMKMGALLPGFFASHRLYMAADETIDHVENRCGEGRKMPREMRIAAE